MRQKQISIIVPARNESKRIFTLVRRLVQWVRKPEVVVVANGCTDDTADLAGRAGAKVIQFDEALGHDVPRAVGLSVATGDILIVIDADMLVQPSELTPFVRAIERGVDLALNRYPLPSTPRFRHPTAVAKRTLNCILDRPDLLASSLTAVPHAISRRALDRLGWRLFAVPPVAQARAELAGLKVEAAAHIPVGLRNPVRRDRPQRIVRDLVIGDCLEAIAVVCEERGHRAGFTDLARRRHVLSDLTPGTQVEYFFESKPASFDVAAVIPAKDEASRLPSALTALRQANIQGVCVIDNGSTDGTTAVAEQAGAQVVRYEDALGHDVPRAAGCASIAADKYVFLDADVSYRADDITAFVAAAADTDVALNDLDGVVPKAQLSDPVSVVKRFLNLALGRPDLGVASLTAVPHILRASVIEQIGLDALAVPPLAMVKAVLAGFKVERVYPVDVVGTNTYRSDLHSGASGRPLQRMIIGDHVEALQFLIQMLGHRGAFVDDVRKRDWLDEWEPADAPTADINTAAMGAHHRRD